MGENLGNQCTVCGEEQRMQVREGYDLYRPNDGKTFRLTRCLACGHVMQNPPPGADELSRAYAIEYAPYRPAWKEPAWHLWKVLRNLTTSRRMRRLKRYAKRGKLLEVGSGAGDFLFAAHRAGWNVAAVEYSEPIVKMLRSELSFDVRSGELSSGLWEPESFDAVILWSVIEHVQNPLEFLAIASSYLKPGGTVFLQFPTVHGVEHGKLFQQYWALLDLPRHLNFFGRESLSKLCNQAGMELTVFKTPLLDIGWCYLASCSNYANHSKSSATKLLKLAVLAPVIALTLPYMLIQARRGHGTEAFAVAVKR
jgi:SAM-dependent methyltransferase